MHDLQAAIDATVDGTHGTPFAFLGAHRHDEAWTVRCFIPGAHRIEVVSRDKGQLLAPMSVEHPAGLFCAELSDQNRPDYQLCVHYESHSETLDDPYSFGTLLGELDIHLIREGNHRELYRVLGAQPMQYGGVHGTRFAVWAPNAKRVSVVGDFNLWDGRRHVMRVRHEVGIWEIFIPKIGEGERYKYEVMDQNGHCLAQKADPYAQGAELRPLTASVVRDPNQHLWQDEAWLARRWQCNRHDAAISIYEVHAGSWRRIAHEGNRFLSYRELADQLIPYVMDMGFTHIQMMPLGEFPFDGSWGYQQTGLFAPTSRFGTPDDFQYFVEQCHAAGLGLLIDWVPGHFPEDKHALGQFDGTALYEHADPRRGFHPDWNTLIYNFGRTEVSNFLTASARHWIDRYHVDGLRVDAVASMLYLDYSRKEGEWIANEHGGNENLEAIALLQKTNAELYGDFPDIMTVAEESTAWPGVSKPVDSGGLGFGFKWNMGWMNDTLRYMSRDPIHRKHHHNELTFGLVYAFDENFILPLSHDEVVHGKGSLIGKMPGDNWQKFANLRAYYGFMWAHPGKKLLFQGCEFAQSAEWNHDQSLDWHELDDGLHAGVQRLVKDLNALYRELPALHRLDCDGSGFRWLDHQNAEESLLSFERHDENGNAVIVICNFTPGPRQGMRFGVPLEGLWEERLNTNAEVYGGSNMGNPGGAASFAIPWQGHSHSIELTVPPLATVILQHRDN